VRIRLAVLADVHANEVALRAVLDEVDRLGVDGLVVAGDLSGFGPAPDVVTDLLRARRTRMIRGNHEKDYVAPYGTSAMPRHWPTSPRTASLCWNMERLGPERRAFLASLPDRLLIDEATLVVHGSPRHARDAVGADTPLEELEAMFAGESCRLAFSGHTHRPVIRDTPSRRYVNVGSVGLPLGGDNRAAYALIERNGASAPADGRSAARNGRSAARDGWTVGIRRVAYDVEAAIAMHRASGCGEGWPDFLEVYARTLRSARDYLGPLLRATRDVPDEQYPAAARAFLDANP
jgi:predicted phosphodiesterase